MAARTLSGAVPPIGASSGITTSSLTLKDFISHLIPTSIFDGMAKNEILQIVVFSVFFGTAAAAVGEVQDALAGADIAKIIVRAPKIVNIVPKR